jgi:hypothetical protein
MFTWPHFFAGILLTAVGVALLRFNFQIVGYTGRQDWIESKMGSGSTYFVYQVFAIIITLGGLIYAAGFGDNVLNWLFSPLKGVFSGFKSQ